MPLSSTALALLGTYLDEQAQAIRQRDGRLYPFWNGDLDENVLDATTTEVSLIFRNVFAQAGIADLHFHDL